MNESLSMTQINFPLRHPMLAALSRRLSAPASATAPTDRATAPAASQTGHHFATSQLRTIAMLLLPEHFINEVLPVKARGPADNHKNILKISVSVCC